jgi:hypothetical protein
MGSLFAILKTGQKKIYRKKEKKEKRISLMEKLTLDGQFGVHHRTAAER